jgi:transcription-repair coupling factor (superfamily II helicase)
LYRRLAAVESQADLAEITDEIRDRFGAPTSPVENLLRSVRLKISAGEARVTSISLGSEALVVRSETSAVYDRVSLYKMYGTEARISTNVLRIPRHALGSDWLAEVEAILGGMIHLREKIMEGQPVGA